MSDRGRAPRRAAARRRRRAPAAWRPAWASLHRLAATPPATTAPTSPPRGPRTPEHLAQNVKAADFALDEATLDRIDALTAPGVDVDPQNRYEIPVPALTDARLRRR
ncbi:hypothetical protein EDL96_05380 [Kocuria soli]|uniref:Aldo/keto reductase n=1 Tax=Kocuria soli TaxID=2485125 RepID=A0A3N4A574_9MICC|nr:hypothetical protein [Kocuria soli]ROZ63780.1 hypothetical protein EDL96_05380 [Kocuria soli]